MKNLSPTDQAALEAVETREWIESLDYVVGQGDKGRVLRLLEALRARAKVSGIRVPFVATTPYINTIAEEEQVPMPGDGSVERRIKSLIRWNALAMVVRANRESDGIGGHISTYASAATLYEVGFNHFFRGRDGGGAGDIIFFQGHASPGIDARAFLEGRLSETHLRNFRHELRAEGGLSSYPHPWLMPDFWEFPTVSMGLGPLMAIYQARFIRYLENRGLKAPSDQKVWAFIGDGETDEPEALGAISLAAREKLDNLIFVVNCNLQRLDGPVRGNGQIVQELEAVFRGAGWNVIKVLWGSDWDELIARDSEGLLVRRMGQIVDGEYQRYVVEDGGYLRKHFWGADPRLLEMVRHLSDHDLKHLRVGGHDPLKVYNAYLSALGHTGGPTVILARTIKGYGLGEAGEGRNITHQQKKMNEADLRHFRDRFGIPISDDQIAEAPFYKPADDSIEVRYVRERRQALGGPVPRRVEQAPTITPDLAEVFDEFAGGTEGKKASTTMVAVSVLTRLMKHKEIGKLIVPIVPDEARTFGMESLFRAVGIYSSIGQLYEPVDKATLLYYKEAKDGQILEEGITEAGSISSWIAAGTAYATHGVNTIPFFIFYSMFGFQRVGDFIWAAADARCRGFLLGGTSGRTTLAGEGLQHQDGNSHTLALTVPTCRAYDPAYAYELAVIVQEGIRRMYGEGIPEFYYLTVMNEQYEMPPMPAGATDGILKGLYRFRSAGSTKAKAKAQLLGSGAILNEVVRAQELLDGYGVAADVWSATSYNELYRDAHRTERWTLRHPTGKARAAYVAECLAGTEGVIVAASDYLKSQPSMISQWVGRPIVTLGTDGFGRSADRAALRDFFEVDARHIAASTLSALLRDKAVDAKVVKQAFADLDIQADKIDPSQA
ncbi:MAG TPA: pyruvate dehydrogenase (acetyl-transferring), homodimeric type [Vicinamibacterales bacterium]|nr:pyruvate dehydrogenase (acetyl-transferring), homodimeric type [Vicinamibacterales bacterium]